MCRTNKNFEENIFLQVGTEQVSERKNKSHLHENMYLAENLQLYHPDIVQGIEPLVYILGQKLLIRTTVDPCVHQTFWYLLSNLHQGIGKNRKYELLMT
jgi:hypothetical protein